MKHVMGHLLTGVLALSPCAALAQGSSTVCARSPTYVGSLPPAQSIATGNDLSSAVTPIQFTPASGNASYATMGPNHFVDTNVVSVASSSSIALPVNTQIHITGTASVSSITGGWQGRRATLTTVDGAVSFTTGGGGGGNGICTAFTSVQYVQIAASYNGSLGCWQLK